MTSKLAIPSVPRRHERRDLMRLVRNPASSPSEILNAFLAFEGRLAANMHRAVSERLKTIAAEAGLAAHPPLSAGGAVHPALLERYASQEAGGFLVPDNALEETVLIEGGPNELWEPRIGHDFRAAGGLSIGASLGARTRPPYVLLEREFADVVIIHEGYATISAVEPTYVPSLSMRSFPICMLPHDVDELDGPLVICRDLQSSANFAHFLFDNLPRMLMFLRARPELVRKAWFLFGSPRRPIHDLLLNPLARMHGIDERKLLFLDGRKRLRPNGAVFGFSDQVRKRAHPMNIGHATLLGVTRDFLAKLNLPTEGDGLRLYISRRDARSRRVANEAALEPVLASHGFRTVAMGELPLETQIGLVRGSDVVMGPHGMGFSHILFHPGRQTVLELCHPSAGTMAYRCIARAAGSHHAYLVGTPSDGGRLDYAIPPEDLAAFLEAQLRA